MCHHPSLLVSLPAELQIKVVEELFEHHACPYEQPLAKDTFLENIKAVRLTCKSLNAAASDIFLKTWFSHRSIIFERKSLLNLYKIATTAPFNKRLIQVEVAVYEFLPELCGNFKTFHDRMEKEARDESCFLRHDHIKEHFLGNYERNANWPRARAAHEAYKKYANDQTELYSRFIHVRLLARALKSLSGTIRTISVNGAQSPLTGAWTRGILQECGISLLNKEKVARHPATMDAVLRAIHLSEVDFCTLVANGLNVSALQLSLPQRHRFSEIGYSHLHNINLRLLDPKTFPSETNAALFRSGLVRNFIQQAHNLMNLGIEFYNNPYDISLDKLLGSRIEKLESLSLGGMTFHAQNLIEWLTENKSKLVHLQIDYSSLITGSWRDVFRKMRSNLDLKTVYFHFLADDEESIHVTGENVNNFILKRSPKVDWETMESKILSRSMADLAGLFSVVVNSHPHHHHPHHSYYHHNHHDHQHGEDGAGPTPGLENANNQNQAQVNHPVAGPAPPADHQNDVQETSVMAGQALLPGHPPIAQNQALVDYFTAGLPGFSSSDQNEAQSSSVVAGPTLPPGHLANQHSVPHHADLASMANGNMTLPLPPPHLMSAMQNLFQNALGVTLDFLDNLEEDEDELSDSLTLDEEDFNDEDDAEDDSVTEEDEDDVDDDDVNAPHAEEGYAEEDNDGYETDDSRAEEILDQMVKGL